jgi:hypothetical protein
LQLSDIRARARDEWWIIEIPVIPGHWNPAASFLVVKKGGPSCTGIARATSTPPTRPHARDPLCYRLRVLPLMPGR